MEMYLALNLILCADSVGATFRLSFLARLLVLYRGRVFNKTMNYVFSVVYPDRFGCRMARQSDYAGQWLRPDRKSADRNCRGCIGRMALRSLRTGPRRYAR